MTTLAKVASELSSAPKDLVLLCPDTCHDSTNKLASVSIARHTHTFVMGKSADDGAVNNTLDRPCRP